MAVGLGRWIGAARLGAVASLVVAALVAVPPAEPGVPPTRMHELAATPSLVPLPFAASHLAVRWTGSTEAVVELQWENTGGAVSAWERAHADHDLGDAGRRRVLSQLTITGGARRVRARVRAGDASALRVVAIDSHPGAAIPARAAPELAGYNPGAAVPQPANVSRFEWGADESMKEPGYTPKFAPITKLVVHHTAGANDDPDPAATVRAIYAYHVKVNGFSDIGYNFLIDANGVVYEGRYSRDPLPDEEPTGEDVQGQGVIGAHAEGVNKGSAGIALLGTFTTQPPTQTAYDALVGMLAWKADRHGVNPHATTAYTGADGGARTFPDLSGHRDTRSTECPGEQLYALLPAIRDAVALTVAAANSTTRGYWTLTRGGVVSAFGDAMPSGNPAEAELVRPAAAIAATPSGLGYWLLGASGRVVTAGDAVFWGSTESMKLNAPVVRIVPTATGRGYWVLAADGGIFTFGDAVFRGSTGAMRLNAPVVGMAATPTGDGYWLVASDGGIFTFGDAPFLGSTGSKRLNAPVVAMEAHPLGRGYWLIASDGGVFAFGAPFLGSLPGLRPRPRGLAVQVRGTSTGRGYYVLGGDGGVFSFGDAKFHGARGGNPGDPSVDMALLGSGPSTPG